MPVALLNYLDRQMLASMKFSVMHDIPDIGLEANWGTILALFKWVYAVPQPDRRLPRRPLQPPPRHRRQPARLVGGHLDDGARHHLRAAARDPRADGHQRGVLHSRRRWRSIADFHTGPTRSRAVGLHQMGIYVGVIIGGFGGYVADHPALGWRWAFDACGIVGIALRRAARSSCCATRRGPGGSRRIGRRRAGSAARTARQRIVHPARALLHAAGARGLDRARLDAGDPQGGVRHRPGAGRRLGDALLAGRPPSSARSPAAGWPIAGCGRTPRGRIYVSAIGMSLIVPAMFGVGYAPQTGLLWVAVAFLILFGLGWGFFDCEQHADPLPDRASRAARHRLRHHEPRQHQLRRLRRLGLRRAARSPGAAVRHLRRLRERRRRSRSCWCC